MNVLVFDTHPYDRQFLDAANHQGYHKLTYLEARLTRETAPLVDCCEAVCAFVNDIVNAEVLEILHRKGVRVIAMRCAGYNNVDLKMAASLDIPIVRVPEYSPYAVAEHAVALLLTLNRKIHRAFNRVREMNFSLNGLVGFDLHGKTVGIIGTGKIGRIFGQIMLGFGCKVLACDVMPHAQFGELPNVQYVDLSTLYAESDIISLHAPLTPETHHLLNETAFEQMKQGVVIINTSRGMLIDTVALIQSLKLGKVGGACLDVYEEEAGIFFMDLSDRVLQDDVLARLITFQNVLITSHQAFLTREALTNIAETTLGNLTAFEQSQPLVNAVHATG